MSYSIQAKIDGLDEMQKAFKQAPQIVNRNMKDAIGRAAFFAEGKAKSYAPVRSGALRGSITAEGPRGSGLDIEAKVGTNLKYAPHQEYGTGIYGKSSSLITPKRAKTLAWKQNGKWIFAKAVRGVQGRFYFKKSKSETIPFLNDAVKGALANITRFLAKG